VFYIGVSLFSLGVLAILTFNLSTSVITFPLQKQLTGSIFITICFIGILVGVFPSRCLKKIHFRSQNKNSRETEHASSQMTTVKFNGHHPTCGNFSAHVLQISGKMYCAGCIGLVIGAIISLFGSLLYFLLEFNAGEIGILIFWLGFTGVFFGILQYNIFNGDRSVVHSIFNVMFVLGAFLLLIGVHEITSNFLLELYLLIIIIYWIMTRIMLSQLEHRKICTICDLKSCSYLKDRLS